MHNKWQKFYCLAKSYREDNGHFAVLKGDSENNNLRKWIRDQIKSHRENALSAEQFRLLSDIDFDFSLFGKQWDNWERNFRKLRSVYISTGSANVSQLTKVIGPWLSSQRVKYRHGELSNTKIALLESINVSWNPSTFLSEQWKSQFEKLKSFYEANGHSNVGRDTEGNLGTWVSAQRTAYRKKLMPKERIDMLESINFKWELRG